MTVVLSDSLLPYVLEELRIPLDVGVASPAAEGRVSDFILSLVPAEG